MRHYSMEEWNREQYKGRWEASPYNLSRVEAGELPAGLLGRRNVMVGGDHGCTLLTEGVHFLVDGDYSQLPVLHKVNAMKGACYQFAGGYIQVTEIYRVSEEDAREHELYYLDRARYIQHAEWGEVEGGCALPGSDVSKYYKNN